jgi:hypothetical protein
MRVPTGRLRVEIDAPADRLVTEASGLIRGWFGSLDQKLPDTFEFRISGMVVPHRLVSRLDVQGAMPDHHIVGFDIPYNLSAYLPYIEDNRFTMCLIMPGYEPYPVRFTIKDHALAMCLATAGGV